MVNLGLREETPCRIGRSDSMSDNSPSIVVECPWLGMGEDDYQKVIKKCGEIAKIMSKAQGKGKKVKVTIKI